MLPGLVPQNRENQIVKERGYPKVTDDPESTGDLVQAAAQVWVGCCAYCTFAAVPLYFMETGG